MKRNFMKIKLTDEQIKQMEPLFDEAEKYHLPGVRNGAVMAQAKVDLATRKDGVLVVGFVGQEHGLMIAEILNNAFNPGDTKL